MELVERKRDGELMTIHGAGKAIHAAVVAWADVTAEPHRFGGTEYRLGRCEIGHVHGDYLVDIPFPTKIRNELVEAGRAEPHHILPETDWVSFFLREPDDVGRAIDLLHYSYELASKQKHASTDINYSAAN